MRIRLIFLFTFLISSTLGAQSVSVPLGHPVYPFLERLEAYNIFSSLALRIQPINRAEVLQMLQRADSLLADYLTPAESSMVQRFLSEFADPAPGVAASPEAEPHILRLEEDKNQIFIDALATQEFDFQRGGREGEKNISRTIYGARLRGNFSGNLGFYAEALNTLERGDKNAEEGFNQDTSETVTISGSSVFKDQALAAFYFRAKWARFEIGRNQLSWGVSPSSQLGLARQNTPVDLIRLQVNWRLFQFTYVHAHLRAAPRRYFAGHRLDVALGKRGRLGIYEGVIYAGRNMEWQYLNPLMPYHIAEHQLGDRDNNVLGVDFSFHLWRATKFYGEIFADDLSLEFPIGEYWGNKLAYLFGAFVARPLGWRDADLRVEYTRVDPFVYTHHDSSNVYAHSGESLGSRLGPNADRISIELGYQPHRDVRFISSFLHDRKGRGNLFTSHRDEEGSSKGFLKGTLETANEWRAEMAVQIRRDVYVEIAYSRRHVTNADRLEGRNETLERALFSVRADY